MAEVAEVHHGSEGGSVRSRARFRRGTHLEEAASPPRLVNCKPRAEGVSRHKERTNEPILRQPGRTGRACAPSSLRADPQPADPHHSACSRRCRAMRLWQCNKTLQGCWPCQ